MWPIVWKEWKLLIREKGNLFWLFLLPIAFIVLFATIFGNPSDSTLTIHYVDQDQSNASKQWIQQFQSMNGIELETDLNVSANQKIEQVREGQLTSLMIFPKGFGKQLQQAEDASIHFYRDEAGGDTAATIKALIENQGQQVREQKLQQQLQSMGKSQEEVQAILASPINIVETIENQSQEDNPITQIVPGYTVMFVFFIMISMVQRFVKEKESGMLLRFQSIAFRPYQYLIGMWIPFVLAVMIQCTVLLIFGNIVYDLPLGNWGALSLLLLALSLCGTGLGLALAVWVRGLNQGIGLTQMIALGGAMVAGLWMPYDFLPSFVQTIGKFTPQYWAQIGLKDVLLRQAGIIDIGMTLAILLLFALVGFLLAVWRFPAYLR